MKGVYMSNKKPYLVDENRQKCINAVNSHVKRNASVLFTGDYGSGKTEFLKQLNKKELNKPLIKVCSLFPLYKILGDMAEVQNVSPRQKAEYLNKICGKQKVFIIDEAQDLDKKVFPYFKLIIDSGNSLIMAGRPQIHEILANDYPDLLSRFTHIEINILGYEQLLELLKGQYCFDDDAVDYLYGASNNMRQMINIAENCYESMKADKLLTVNEDMVREFI
jgi:replication-associated recombination protein RarA